MRATRRIVEGTLTREIELDQNVTKACMSSEMRRPASMTSDRREDLGDNNAADIDKLRLLDFFGVAMTQADERSRSYSKEAVGQPRYGTDGHSQWQPRARGRAIA